MGKLPYVYGFPLKSLPAAQVCEEIRVLEANRNSSHKVAAESHAQRQVAATQNSIASPRCTTPLPHMLNIVVNRTFPSDVWELPGLQSIYQIRFMFHKEIIASNFRRRGFSAKRGKSKSFLLEASAKFVLGKSVVKQPARCQPRFSNGCGVARKFCTWKNNLVPWLDV